MDHIQVEKDKSYLIESIIHPGSDHIEWDSRSSLKDLDICRFVFDIAYHFVSLYKFHY